MLSVESVREALKGVIYPNFTKDIVEYGFVKNIEIHEGSLLVVLDIPAASNEIADTLKKEIVAKAGSLEGVKEVFVQVEQPKEHKESSSHGKNLAPTIKNFIMVSSGKGGVGKSTTTVNLAIAAAQMGKKVGILDADIYGPNVPRMMGLVAGEPEVVNNRIKPLHKMGVEVMSMGLLMEEGQSLIWRGPMVMRVIDQLLKDVEWGDLDILFIDMPPGTGDAQLTLAQSVPVTCGIVVTTPQLVALDDAKRSLDMFDKLNIPLGGIVENMSGFICPESGKEYDIFGRGSGEELAKSFGTQILAEIPIEMAVREGGDAGKPVTFHNPSTETAKRYRMAAEKLWDKVVQINTEGAASNAEIQPTIGLDGKSSACGGGAPVQHSHGHEHGSGGCGCGH